MKNGRFIKIRTGLTLVLATAAATILTLGAPRPASAQLLSKSDTYAVVDFNVKVPSTDVNLSEEAREAVRSELATLGKLSGNKLECVASDRVTSAMTELGLQPPVKSPSDLLRLGQALDADYIVSGTVYNWRIVPGTLRHAEAILQIVVRDRTSGLIVNGAAVTGKSGDRSGDVTDGTLLKEAIKAAAFNGVRDLSIHTLARATVTNTIADRIYINKGARSGFTKDQRVVIRRGREQVAEAQIVEVDQDSSFAKIIRQTKGVQPTDKVEAIYAVPEPTGNFASSGEGAQTKKSGGGSNNGIISLLLVLVVLAFLLGQGRGSNQAVINNVIAESATSTADVAGVKVSWTRDVFGLGNNEGPVKWQVYREGAGGAPVAVTGGSNSSAVDDTAGSQAPGVGNPYGVYTQIGGYTCISQTAPATTTPVGPPAIVGRPARYYVEVVYSVSQLSLPPAGTTGGAGGGGTAAGGTAAGGTAAGGTAAGGTAAGGTAAGGTAAGGTAAGGTAAGGTGGGNPYCYFLSSKVASSGQATPLRRPRPVTPVPGSVVKTPTPFSFNSVREQFTIPLEYVIQISPDSQFGAGNTVTLDPFPELVAAKDATVGTPSYDMSTYFPAVTGNIFWRVGVRNPDDSPGPVPDQSGKRYVFGPASYFTRK